MGPGRRGRYDLNQAGREMMRRRDLWAYRFVLSAVMRAAMLREVLASPDRVNVKVTQTPEYHFQERRIKL
jgi:hypothetical protein